MSINSLIDSARSFFGTQSRLRERMLSILKGLGKEPLNSSPERILFYCDHENYKIPVGVALVDKETILLQVMSNITGGVDSTLRRILEASNGHLPCKHISFFVTESSRICVQSFLPFSDLNSAFLGSRLREMLPLIRDFDEELRNRGF